jgi:IS66 C-terminal element
MPHHQNTVALHHNGGAAGTGRDRFAHRDRKLNDVEPHAYLATTITKIVNEHPNSGIDELLPWAYPAANALKDVA